MLVPLLTSAKTQPLQPRRSHWDKNWLVTPEFSEESGDEEFDEFRKCTDERQKMMDQVEKRLDALEKSQKELRKTMDELRKSMDELADQMRRLEAQQDELRLHLDWLTHEASDEAHTAAQLSALVRNVS